MRREFRELSFRRYAATGIFFIGLFINRPGEKIAEKTFPGKNETLEIIFGEAWLDRLDLFYALPCLF